MTDRPGLIGTSWLDFNARCGFFDGSTEIRFDPSNLRPLGSGPVHSRYLVYVEGHVGLAIDSSSGGQRHAWDIKDGQRFAMGSRGLVSSIYALSLRDPVTSELIELLSVDCNLES
jgi:hypothetical protein